MDAGIDRYVLPAVVTMAGVNQLMRFTKAVGKARGQYGVKVPETTGPPEFMRVFRAHQNSVEFFPMSLTNLWIGSVFFHPVPASLAYAGYLIGREFYFRGYVQSAEKRIPGFMWSIRFLIALHVMSLAGVGHRLIRYYGNIDLWQMICDHVPLGKNEL